MNAWGSTSLCHAAQRLAVLSVLLVNGCAGPAAAPTSAPGATDGVPHSASPASTVVPSAPSSPDTPTASPSTPLTLPSNWQAVEPTTEGMQTAADTVRDSNPDLAAILDEGAASGTADQFELIAIGQDGTRYMGVMNVARLPGPGTTLDALESMATGSGGAALPTDLTGIESRRIQLPIGEALMVTASIGTWFAIGYYVIVGDEVIRVDIVCDPRSHESCQRDSDEMMRTLTIAAP